MSKGLVSITVDHQSYGKFIQEFAGAMMIGYGEALRLEGKLYSYELIRLTPPFTGQAIRRMQAAKSLKIMGLSGQDMRRAVNKLADQIRLSDPQINDASAQAVGKRRVEKDIRKVFWGVPRVYGHASDKCIPNPTEAQLAAIHNAARGSRGRVRTVRRRIVVPEAALQAYIKSEQARVGQGKGGWARSYIKLGGRMSERGWIGKHSKTGECTARLEGPRKEIILINRSAWAQGGDPDRIREAAMEGREKSLAKNIDGIMRGLWGTPKRNVQFRVAA